jgi:hypothetical protein
MTLPNRAWVEVTYLAYRVGLCGYCWVCDDFRWAWTHRGCGRRHHAASAAVARALHDAGWRP